MHRDYDELGLPLHDWVERHIQAIEATCRECGKVELHLNRRGGLRGIQPSKQGASKERATEMLRLSAEEYLSFTEIGVRYGVSRERVRQIIKSVGGDPTALSAARLQAISARNQPRPCGICGKPLFSSAASSREAWQEHRATFHQRSASYRAMRLGSRLSPEKRAQRAEIAADYAAGVKEKDIQAKYSVSGTVITDALALHGLTRNRNEGRRLPTMAQSQARAEAVVAAIQAGKRPTEVAAEFGVSTSLIGQITQKAGIRTPRAPRPITPEEREEWIALWKAGLSVPAVARKFVRSHSTIYSYLDQIEASR